MPHRGALYVSWWGAANSQQFGKNSYPDFTPFLHSLQSLIGTIHWWAPTEARRRTRNKTSHACHPEHGVGWRKDMEGQMGYIPHMWFSSVQFSHSVVSVSLWPHELAARQAFLSITISRSSPKLMCIEWLMPSSHLILCHPLFLLPQTPPSIRVFCNESTLRMRWPKYWSFSFRIIPSKEIPGLISFRMEQI